MAGADQGSWEDQQDHRSEKLKKKKKKNNKRSQERVSVTGHYSQEEAPNSHGGDVREEMVINSMPGDASSNNYKRECCWGQRDNTVCLVHSTQV